MALFLVSGPSSEPISLDEALTHLRIDGTDEYALIGDLIQGAREYVETFTRRALLSQTWDLKRDAFPCGPIWVPLPRCQSIASISYIDTNGTTQTWSSALYTTDLPTGPHAGPGRIVPAYGETYPSTRSVPNAVTVRFVAGYGTEADVPALIRACLKEHVRAHHERCSADEAEKLMQWVNSQLWTFRVADPEW